MLTGNREYNEIYKKYKNLVLKVAYIYSGDNYDAAEDITQDTFLKLYIGFEELKDGNVSAWLYTTAKNSALNFNKKFKREVLSEDDELYKKQRAVWRKLRNGIYRERGSFIQKAIP
jgi:RNA polymerase sigma factor, sigma-70 family